MPSSPSSDHQAQAGVSEPSTPQAQSVTAAEARLCVLVALDDIAELRKYVVHHGAIHCDGCPCDDTCDCCWKKCSDAVNRICNAKDFPPSPEVKPQPVEAGWRSRCRIVKAIARPGWYIVINEHSEAGPRLRWCKSGRWHADDMDIYWDSEEEARAALSKAPQPPDIKPANPNQGFVNMLDRICPVPEPKDVSGKVVEAEPRCERCGYLRGSHGRGSGISGRICQEFVPPPSLSAEPKVQPPDSKPPTQSEDKWKPCCEGGPVGGHAHGCPTLCSPSPTKPTESVQPWPEDLSVLVGRMIVTRMKHEGTHIAPLEFVVARAYPRFVTDEFDRQAWPKHRDLLSVSPPLEAKPQSGQSEGKVPKGATLTIRVYQEDGYWVARCEELDVLTADPSRETVEADIRRVCEAQIMFGIKTRSVARVLNYKFFPTQPKDSKEMGPIQPGTDEHEREFGSRECGAVAKCNQLEAALKSANERAEEAEKELATLKGAKRD